jgi:hypothetical protein
MRSSAGTAITFKQNSCPVTPTAAPLASRLSIKSSGELQLRFSPNADGSSSWLSNKQDSGASRGYFRVPRMGAVCAGSLNRQPVAHLLSEGSTQNFAARGMYLAHGITKSEATVARKN